MRSQIVDGRLKHKRQNPIGNIVFLCVVVSLGFCSVFMLIKTVAENALGFETKAPSRHDLSFLPDRRMVGRWVSNDGTRILISSSGAIWADAGDLLGEGTFKPDGDAINLSYVGPKFRCIYRVNFRNETSDWILTDQTVGTVCPAGKFAKPFMF